MTPCSRCAPPRRDRVERLRLLGGELDRAGGAPRPRAAARAAARAARSHQSAALQPPQRAEALARRARQRARAAPAGCRSAARRRALAGPARAHSTRARPARRGSTSDSARAGVEQYSAAIHAPARRARADAVRAHRARRGEPLRRHARSPRRARTTPSSRWRPNGTRTTSHPTRLGRQHIVERPGQPAGRGQGLDRAITADSRSRVPRRAAREGRRVETASARRQPGLHARRAAGSVRSSTSTRRSTPAAQPRRTLAAAADGDGDRTGFGGRRYRTRLLERVVLPRRVRGLPRLPRAAAARGPAAAAPDRDALLPHRLPRGALLQAAARRAVRPRAVPQRADLGLRLRRQAEAPLARQSTTRSSSTSRTRRATASTPRRSTASRTWRRAS